MDQYETNPQGCGKRRTEKIKEMHRGNDARKETCQKRIRNVQETCPAGPLLLGNVPETM